MSPRFRVLPLALCLLLSGCSIEDVNSVAIIDYERRDGVVAVPLKTLGNIVFSAMWGALFVGYGACMAAGEAAARRAGSRGP